MANGLFSSLFALLLVIATCSSTPVAAEALNAYPSRPVRLVVPFPPGGSADIVARVIAKPLSELLGQAVFIDNKPGADGAIAAEYVAQAEPDGYTLFMATYGAMSAVPTLHKNLHYDAVTDFTPITSTGKFAFFLFVHPSVPAQTLPELIVFARKHPGLLNYATGNTGAIVATAELSAANKIEMTHVPYKGEVPAMNDFLAGRVQVMFATSANALPWVQQGKLRALVTLLDKRSPLLPDVPTMAESGLHNLHIVPWSGVFGPAKMPEQLSRRLSLAINEIVNRADIQAEFARQGFEGAGSSPEQLQAYVKDQLKVWGRTIQLAGLKPE
jgi:tripartite-type tricarboxylate transporter receptor subunit TctC